MKVSQMIIALKEILDEHGDLDVVYSVDEEGNSFHHVAYTPSIGLFSRNEFVSKEDEDDEINAICIN